MLRKIFPERSNTGQPPSNTVSAKARAYVYRNMVLVCSVRWIAETDNVSRLDENISDFELGKTILRHLDDYNPTEWDICDRAKTDWAALKQSGAASVNAFEREAWIVELEQMNSAVQVWASPCKTLDRAGLAAYTAANSNMPDEVGMAVRKACEAARALRELKHF